jgi:hypothetical protein
VLDHVRRELRLERGREQPNEQRQKGLHDRPGETPRRFSAIAAARFNRRDSASSVPRAAGVNA